MAKGKKSNQRPKDLSEFVFWLPSVFIEKREVDAYLRKVRRLEKPVIHLDRDRSRYPYYVELDVVEGFSTNRMDLKPKTIAEIREAFKARKTTKQCFEEMDIHERVFIGKYRTLEDAVSVANLLASINYEFTLWETAGHSTLPSQTYY